MPTRPKVPPPTLPLLDERGLIRREWYEFFSRLPQVGEFQTTVGAAGGASALPATPKGYRTEIINDTPYVFPFYLAS